MSVVSETDSLLKSVDIDNIPASQECCRPGYGVRRVKSRGAVLVLLWTIAISVFPRTSATLAELVPVENTGVADTVGVAIQAAVYIFYYPFAGWLADVYFGRYKVMHANLLLMWVGSVATIFAMLLKYQFPHDTIAAILNYGILLPASIAVFIGQAGFLVISLPFGMDQMPDASAEEVSAFIHWFAWALSVGKCISKFSEVVISCEHYSPASLLQPFIGVVFLSFALSTIYLFRSWLTIEPQSQNPLKAITSVLKYAATHQYPTRRSAFTYWEEEIPSRVDLGKSKYGGPFTNEQVEDVKTFFRIVVVVSAITAFFIPAFAILNTIEYVQPNHYGHSSNCYSSFTVYNSAFILLTIPLYEFFVYPLARNWIPSTLKRVAAGAFLTIAISLYLTMLDAVGTSQTTTPVPCMFLANASSPVLDVNYLLVDIPSSSLLAIQIILFDVAAFEFICAQSPYNMKGLLTGIEFAVFETASIIGYMVHFTWSQCWKDPFTSLSCGIWYYLFITAIGSVGLVILVIVAMWYKERERDEIVNERGFVEEYYSRYSHS